MEIPLPENAPGAFTDGSGYVLDNSFILAYGLQGVSSDTVTEVCHRATETFAREVLKWPHGRLAKPDIFTVSVKRGVDSVEQCAQHFTRHLTDLYKTVQSRELPTYPHAFVVITEEQLPSKAVVVLANQANDAWHLEQRLLPVNVELAMQLESLRLGDITKQDILDHYKHCNTAEPLVLAVQPPPKDARVFAVFSTGLKAALPLAALIDPTTERVPPSEASLQLIADPVTCQLYMTRPHMLELFPVICRDDERRGWRTKGRTLHRQVFICCDNDKPKEKGLLIMKTDWDGNIDQDEKALRKAGSEATIQETRVTVEEALAKAREMTDKTSV